MCAGFRHVFIGPVDVLECWNGWKPLDLLVPAVPAGCYFPDEGYSLFADADHVTDSCCQ